MTQTGPHDYLALMARSLPENTVDAWSAISLAGQGASWIWLPTARAGATTGGSHPGDVSTLDSGRLVLIESKAIEAEKEIDFGPHHASQNEMLIQLQEYGQRLVEEWNDTSVGWIAYGLPEPRRWNGAEFRQFPSRHALLCPHLVQPRRLDGDRKLDEDVWAWLFSEQRPCGVCGPERPSLLGFSRSLDTLGGLVRRGLFGLPVAQLSCATSQLTDVAAGRATAQEIEVPSLPSTFEEYDLLAVIEGLAEASRNDDGPGFSCALVL